MRVFIFMGMIIFLGGCGQYSNIKHFTTTTTKPNGDVVVESKICETRITSMREVKAGDLKVSSSCAVQGSAESLSSKEINQKIVDLGLGLLKLRP